MYNICNTNGRDSIYYKRPSCAKYMAHSISRLVRSGHIYIVKHSFEDQTMQGDQACHTKEAQMTMK